MKLKRILAVAMATTMVMAMSVTAFAANPEDGSLDGAGTSEGHVDKHLTKVVLPTMTAEGIAYTIDPERLIQATSGEKYGKDFTFPAAATDTGVYFLTDTKTYSNSSNYLEIINKSSDDKIVTVKYKFPETAGGKDIALVTSKPSLTEDATTAGLYMAIEIGEGENDGDVTTANITRSEQSTPKKLAGVPGNFEVVVNEQTSGDTTTKVYAYQQKTTGLSAWKALRFRLTGAVTKGASIASDTTTPTVTLTWSITDPGENDTTSTTGVGTANEFVAAKIDLLTGGDGTTYITGAPDVEGGFATTIVADKITSVKMNGADLTAKAGIGRNMVVVSWPEVRTALGVASFDEIPGGAIEMVFVYDGTTYKGTYTKQ